MTDRWLDNSPCDRADPAEWAFAGVCVGMLGVFGAAFSWWYLSLGGSEVLAASFGTILAVAAAYLLLLGILIQRDFLAEVSFRSEEMTGRTRVGRTSTVAYARIIKVRPWPKRAKFPRRYHVLYEGERFRSPEGLWLTPDNKTRLDEAMRKARER